VYTLSGFDDAGSVLFVRNFDFKPHFNDGSCSAAFSEVVPAVAGLSRIVLSHQRMVPVDRVDLGAD